MNKKIITGLLCVLMAINTFSATKYHADNEISGVVYVDSTVSQSGNGKTQSTAFKTLNEAITSVDKETADEHIVKIIGKYDWSSDVSAHTNLITLCGNNSNEDQLVLNKDILDIGGPLTIDNITLSYGGQYTIHAKRNQLVFGSGVVSTGTNSDDWNTFRPRLVSGGYNSYTNSSSTPSHNITVNGGKFWNVYLGESVIRTEWTCVTNGVDFVMNAGTLYNLNIGGNAWDGNRGENSYKGNINITVNGGNIYGGIKVLDNKSSSAEYKSPNFNGNAVQIILNNGTNVSNLPDSDTIKSLGGKLYILKSEKKTGCMLSPTDNYGEFKVTSTEGLAALATDEAGNKFYSENDVLKLSKSGLYTVTFVPAQISQNLFVDSINGSDDNSGDSSDKALKTLERAFTLLESSENENPTIKIVGTYTVDKDNYNLPEHSKNIALIGNDSSSELKLTYSLNTNGSVTIKNIKLSLVNNKDIQTNGGNLVIDENVVIADYPYLRFYTGLTNKDNTSYENATIKSGNIDALWVGTNDVRDAEGKTTAGANVVIDGAMVRYVRLGGHGYEIADRPSIFHDTIFKGDVNITVNNGQVGNLEIMSPEGESQNSRHTVFDSAVQIVVNENGYISGEFPQIEAKVGVWYMDGHGQSGGVLSLTETSGKFSVESEKTAFAYAKDGSAVYKSDENGYLTVPAGNYKVVYKDDDSVMNTGSLIKFYQDTAIDITTLTPPEIPGKIFIGWQKISGGYEASAPVFIKDGQMKAGDELTACYKEFDTSSSSSNSSSLFAVIGTQVRLKSSGNKKDLRFIIELGNDILKESKLKITEYGAIAIPSAFLETSELRIDGKQMYDTDTQLINVGKYSYDEKEYEPAIVKADKIFKNKSNSLQYTICLTGISAEKYSTLFAVRGYIKYTDANNNSRIVYTTCFDDSMFEAADRMLSTADISKTDAEPLKDIQNSCLSALKKKYDYDEASTTIDYEINYQSYTMPDNVIKNSSGGIAMTYRKFNKTGLIVRDVDIEAVKGNSNPDSVCVIQMTDNHLNYINAEDIEEGNPALLANLKWRGVNNLNNRSRKRYDKSLVNTVNALEFAKAYGDQTVVTGDIIDSLSYGSLNLMKRYICDYDKTAILTQGNHDVVRANSSARPGGIIRDLSSLDSRNKVLEKYWTNDIFYTSKILKDKVMVIQLDNGQNKFYDEQAKLLENDLSIAHSKNLTVLIFAHIQIHTGDDSNTVYTSMMNSDPYTDGLSVKSFIDSGKVVDLIKNNADIIKGVFTGHQHADFYTEIKAKTIDGTDAIIPQYVLTANMYDDGHLIKINVR